MREGGKVFAKAGFPLREAGGRLFPKAEKKAGGAERKARMPLFAPHAHIAEERVADREKLPAAIRTLRPTALQSLAGRRTYLSTFFPPTMYRPLGRPSVLSAPATRVPSMR